MRLFIAVDPPAPAIADFRAAVETLAVARAHAPGNSTRLTDPSQWHVTLAFLGEVPEAKVDAATNAIRLAVADGAGDLGLRIAGGGTFGRGESTILWAGVAGDVAGLRKLADSLRRHLRRARLATDQRPLHPHLTIARPGTRVAASDVALDVVTLGVYVGPLWYADAVHLVLSESVQTPSGPKPRYTRLHSEPL